VAIQSRDSPRRSLRARGPVSCPHYPNCFGCPFIGLLYPEQLIRKRERVVAAFSRYPALAGIEVLPVTPAPRQLGYRGRVKLVVRKTKNEIMTGLYVPGSHRVIDISACPVHPRPVNVVLRYLKPKLRDLGVVPYDERDDTGELRYLDFRYSFAKRELIITFVTRNRSFREGKALALWLKERFPFVSGVIQNINESRGNVIWGGEYRTLIGHDRSVEKLGDFELEFPVNVFSQSNPFMASTLYQTILGLSGLKGDETVVDLYSGVGPISLHLARTARGVWGIDDSPVSTAAAERNARRNGITNCWFIAGDVADGLLEVKQRMAAIDLIVLNPPRKGVQPKAMNSILTAGSPKIIYVSCEPESLARDLELMTADGYTVNFLRPFDMIPQTEAVETLVFLKKSGASGGFPTGLESEQSL
jgi:23S rRNA (uracil1939-C5)-methyltransferase